MPIGEDADGEDEDRGGETSALFLLSSPLFAWACACAWDWAWSLLRASDSADINICEWNCTWGAPSVSGCGYFNNK